MAPGLSPIPSDSSTSLAGASSKGKQPEQRSTSSSQGNGNGSNVSMNAGYMPERSKNAKGVFTRGPYLLDDDSMTNLSNGNSVGTTGGLDGTIFSKLSGSTNEGRFKIPGPYEPDASQALQELDFGRDNTLEPGALALKNPLHIRTVNASRGQVYDPDGFGDDLDEADTPAFIGQAFSSSPVESVRPGTISENGSHVRQASLDLTASAPPAPNHAPPPVPGSGSYPPPAKRAAPPVSLNQTRRRRAQSESSPPVSPPLPVAGFLQPPATSHAHRKSSPPAPRIEQTPATPTGAQMPRLQQRHTLQVPQAGIATLQRDMLSSSGDEGLSKNTSPTVSNRRTSMNLIRRHSRNIHSDLQLNEIPQDEDAARRAEAMKQKLAARRKRREEEEDDRVLVGTRVDQNHQNWVTAYNMLTGIRFTVSRTNAKVTNHELSHEDFTRKHKYAFDVAGTELTPSAKYDFKFKDYAPQVFRELRNLFNIDPADYLVSLTSKILLSELASPGKSKSFFYFSRDYKYIIKTVHHAEHKLLRKILPKYFEHVEQNRNTLLSQFYGLHRIKSTWGAHKIHFVVMNNLFPPHRDIHQTYDLKGSTVGRELKEDDLDKNPRGTLKDLNWLKRNQHLAMGSVMKKKFIDQMEKDVKLLEDLGIMDYSLLVGIHDLTKGNMEGLRDKTLKVYQPGGNEKNEPTTNRDSGAPGLSRTPSSAEKNKAARELRANLRVQRPVSMDQAGIDMPDTSAADRTSRMFTQDDGGIRSHHEDGTPGTEIYYLGIIDCLTKYGFVKRLEHFVKGLSNDKNAISAVQPRAYGGRFVQFMKGISKTDEEAARERQEEEEAEKPRQSSSVPFPDNSEANIGSPEMTPAQQNAEWRARNSIDNLSAEEHQRTLGTVRASSTQDGREQVTLPILEEVGESGSTGNASAKSRSRERSSNQRGSSRVQHVERERSVGASSMRRQQSSGAQSLPPPTREAPQAPVYGGRPPPTPPKEMSPEIGHIDEASGRFIAS